MPTSLRQTASLFFWLCGSLMFTALPAQPYGSWDTPIPDLESWWAPVEDFDSVQAGEHPRLLFRKSDLPALRAKMDTPAGQALLQRLRLLLNGSDGQGMPTHFNPAQEAYSKGGWESTTIDSPGVYTFGHVVGYGLLYQLTGEKRYAEWGKQCFELALKGQRDRDDRYSWVDPGGPLRAGPVLGWMAVGYDLCYDGWNPAAQKYFGQAIEQYHTGLYSEWGDTEVDFKALVRGTMPPKSNHYSMQTGGAALALLAITQEPWADQARIDRLLKVSARALVHNVTQGFGDGGYFAEGDGTGSMASQICYLTAVQAWRHVMGQDFAATGRPNVPMTALKWTYLTKVHHGKPAIWPVRGGYPHNAWSRRGISGGGYFGLAFGVLPDSLAAAHKWFYEHFLLEADTQVGTPYEPSVYPHLVATAFVNWPVDLESRNPSEVLPHCYRDSLYGFYAWRNRWQDENDLVITALTQEVRGFMGTQADTAFHVWAYGQKQTWGAIPGAVKHWERSEAGVTSQLHFENGQVVAVDLSGKSGADAVLISTGYHEGQQFELKGQAVTVKCLTQGEPPTVQSQGNRLRIGKREVRWNKGGFHFK